MDILRIGERLQPGGPGVAAQAAIVSPPEARRPTELSVPANHEPAAVEQALKKVNQVVSAIEPDLQFMLDKATGKTVVKVVDTQTNEVIRQFPSEEMLAIARAIDKLQGLLIKEKA